MVRRHGAPSPTWRAFLCNQLDGIAAIDMFVVARVWFDELASGRVRSLAEIARNEGIAKRYVERLSRLAFVIPAIVEAICQGQQPAELSTETLLNRIDLPLEWSAQRNALGIK